MKKLNARAHHDLDERVCNEVQSGEFRSVERKLDNLRKRIERAGLDNQDYGMTVFMSSVAVVATDIPGHIPDAPRNEAGHQNIVGQRYGILRSGETREMGDENGIACANCGEQGCCCLVIDYEH